ncbi:hypothetical protein IMZ08_13040 [Bacillus luteolus]|uniref:DUF4129 domain-containing protein n=1 Tax=Litchfieldia luteola TaxID=682179 RepID=A0ABR9QKF6_9BACI|nr:hypothetical protein [Cytobacillus luteolus]MBE4908988.1 hypothetical protein [Cytobacillus luteolus]MBP1941847.1 hypothetical protein [Cytobacillus luteolus]
MQDSTFQRVYQYIMEVIFLYIVLVLFYFHTTSLPPILPFIIIVAFGGLAYLSLLSRLKNRTPFFVVMILIPIIAYVSSMFGYGFGMSLVLSAFVCWRVIAYYNQGYRPSESTILVVTLIVGFLVYLGSVVQGYPLKNIALYLIISQLLFLMFGKMINGIYISSVSNKSQTVGKQTGSMAGMFFGLTVAAAVIAVGFPLLFKFVLSGLMSLVGKGMYAISVPLFNAVDNAEFSSNSQGDTGGVSGWDKALEDKELQAIGESLFNIWTVLGILSIIVIAVIAFMLARKRMIRSEEVVAAGIPFSMTTGNAGLAEQSWFKKRKDAPSEKVRRLVLELETHAAKKGRGRFGYETVEEWLSRERFLDRNLVSAYEKVRYGEEQLSEIENAQCDDIVKQLKSQMRDLKKDK